MIEEGKKSFCTICKKDTNYNLKKETCKKVIKAEEYDFDLTIAICDECGSYMDVDGIIDLNAKEIDGQYRKINNLITIEDIKRLMENYNIGKAPLSLVLGFGEITLTRYLSGQMPSKEYSDIIRKALVSPEFMIDKLNENKEKIAPNAYSKALEAANKLNSLFSVSSKMLMVISYIFSKLEEVTPLMLQKILYFVQGISLALNHKPMFNEECQAWVHGPVYPKVYEMFKDFKYNPIDDSRFAVLENIDNELSSEDLVVINLVMNTFGCYGGKILEKITHKEKPWLVARGGCPLDLHINEKITLEAIQTYYEEKDKEYDFSSEEGLMKYITATISK